MKRLLVVGCLGIVAACATVQGTAIPLDQKNKKLLNGKWEGRFEAYGAITGRLRANGPVTLVFDVSAPRKSTYSVASKFGEMVWKVTDGNVVVNLERGVRLYRLSRTPDGTLHLQTNYGRTITDQNGDTWPQNVYVLLTKQ